MKNQMLIERILELENDIEVIIGMLSELRVDVHEKNEMAYVYGLEVYKKTSLFKDTMKNQKQKISSELRVRVKVLEDSLYEILDQALNFQEPLDTIREIAKQALGEIDE